MTASAVSELATNVMGDDEMSSKSSLDDSISLAAMTNPERPIPADDEGPKFFVSRRGAHKLAFHGYLYNLVRRRSEISTWICVKYKESGMHCSGRAKCIHGKVLVVTGHKNHPPDYEIVAEELSQSKAADNKLLQNKIFGNRAAAQTKVAVSEGIPAEDLMEDIEESGPEEGIKQRLNAESTSNTCSTAESTSNLYSNAESISNICLNVESTVSTSKLDDAESCAVYADELMDNVEDTETTFDEFTGPVAAEDLMDDAVAEVAEERGNDSTERTDNMGSGSIVYAEELMDNLDEPTASNAIISVESAEGNLKKRRTHLKNLAVESASFYHRLVTSKMCEKFFQMDKMEKVQRILDFARRKKFKDLQAVLVHPVSRDAFLASFEFAATVSKVGINGNEELDVVRDDFQQFCGPVGATASVIEGRELVEFSLDQAVQSFSNEIWTEALDSFDTLPSTRILDAVNGVEGTVEGTDAEAGYKETAVLNTENANCNQRQQKSGLLSEGRRSKKVRLSKAKAKMFAEIRECLELKRDGSGKIL